MKIVAAFCFVSLIAFCAPAIAQPTSRPPCVVSAEDVRAAGPGCEREWIDANLSINELQVVGTAESYKLAPSAALISLIRMGSEDDVRALDYSQPPLQEQLDAGARSLDFDIAYDPKGGLYKFPAGASMAGELISDKYIAEMSSPGFKVIHIIDIDFNSSCTTLEMCLQEVADWSRSHKDHLPLTIFLRSNDARTPMPGATKPAKFDQATFDALDQQIKSIFKPEELITPDDIQGTSASLQEAVQGHGWPKVGASRGKILFVLDDTPLKVAVYRGNRHSLEGRAMFIASDGTSPAAAFITVQNPAKESAAIKRYVHAGFIVHTFADAETKEARANTSSRRDWAFSSGAQIISTDFLKPDRRLGPYNVCVPGGRTSQCDLEVTKKVCGNLDLEPGSSAGQ